MLRGLPRFRSRMMTSTHCDPMCLESTELCDEPLHVCSGAMLSGWRYKPATLSGDVSYYSAPSIV